MARHFVAASSQYLDIVSAVVSVPPFTIAGWFKPVSAAVTYELVTIESNSGATKYLGLLQLASGAVRAVTSDASTSGTATASGTFTAGAWNHAAVTFTSTTSRAAFLNGAGKGTDTTSVTSPTVGRTTIGRLFNSGGAATQYFDGDASDVAIWNVVLDNEEIAALAAGISPLKIRPASIVSYWPLAGVASPEPDSVGSNNLTVTGATAGTSQTLISPSSNVAAVVLGGTAITTSVRLGSVRITDTLNQPKTCTFRIDGTAPAAGNDIKFLLGASPSTVILFAGVVVKVTQAYEGKKANLCWDVYCEDYTYLLNRRRPVTYYPSQSATTIAQSVISTNTSGFGSSNVEASLASVDVEFNGTETTMQCLLRLAKLVACYCHIDFAKDLYFATSESSGSPDALDGTGSTLMNDPPVTYDIDMDSLRNRVYVEGVGTSIAAPVPASSTIVPVESTTGFASSGGVARARSNRLTYTGASLSNADVAAPTGSWSLATAAGVGSLTINTSYTYKIEYTTASGVTLASSASSSVSSGDDGSGHGHNINVHFTPTSGTIPGNATGWKFLRSTTASAGAGPWKVVSDQTGTNPFTSMSINGYLGVTDSLLADGSVAETTTSTAGPEVIVGTTTTSSTAVGATSAAVTETGHMSWNGGIALVTVNGHPFVIKYTGVTVGFGAGSINGIPATGYGSVQEVIASGTQIQNIPALTGVTGLSTALRQGDAIVIYAQRDDATAQTTRATAEGGDGIHEHVIQDGTLLSVTACNTRGDADLAVFKNGLTTIRYATRDTKTKSGKTISVNLPSPTSVTGSFKITQVTIDQIDLCAGRMAPRYMVEASTARFSLEDLLRQLGTAA